MLPPLGQEPDDVLVVEALEDHAARAARANEPEAAEEAELMRDGRFRQAQQRCEIAHAELRCGERTEEPDARRIAQSVENLRQALDGDRIWLCGADFGHARGVGVKHVTGEVWSVDVTLDSHEYMSNCSYIVPQS